MPTCINELVCSLEDSTVHPGKYRVKSDDEDVVERDAVSGRNVAAVASAKRRVDQLRRLVRHLQVDVDVLVAATAHAMKRTTYQIVSRVSVSSAPQGSGPHKTYEMDVKKNGFAYSRVSKFGWIGPYN